MRTLYFCPLVSFFLSSFLPTSPSCQVSSWSIQSFGHSAPMSQTDRQVRQRSDSIGRTVLQTVAQKLGNETCMKNSGHRLTLSLNQRPIQSATQPVNDQSINGWINQSNYSYTWSHLFCTIAGLALTFSGSLISNLYNCISSFCSTCSHFDFPK